MGSSTSAHEQPSHTSPWTISQKQANREVTRWMLGLLAFTSVSLPVTLLLTAH